MKDQLLDAHGIEYAILISSFQPTDMRAQPEFATALASAYNDWVLDSYAPTPPMCHGFCIGRLGAARSPVGTFLALQAPKLPRKVLQNGCQLEVQPNSDNT